MEGQSYKKLRKCVTINILNFTILPNERYHNVFHLREDHSGLTLIDDIEIHIMELSKLNTQSIPNEGGLLNWLLFLKSEDTTNWEVLKEKRRMGAYCLIISKFKYSGSRSHLS